MKHYFLYLLFVFFSLSVYSQEQDRVVVSGKIVAESNDKEGVTVYNISSNKGTITNEKGEFSILVKLNDRIEISALQFEKFTVRVDEQVMDSKKITVFLVEQINKLDEVIILPYDLTGNLPTDIESVRTFNPDLDAIYFGVNDVSAFEFGDDYKSEVRNTVLTNSVDNVIGADLLGVVDLLINTIFSGKKKDRIVVDRRKLFPEITTKDLRDYYSNAFIVSRFDIPEDDIDSFIVFAEDNGLDYSLLRNDRELEFLDSLKKQSVLFLKSKRD